MSLKSLLLILRNLVHHSNRLLTRGAWPFALKGNLLNSRIHIAKDNHIILGDNIVFRDFFLKVIGSNNSIHIGNKCKISGHIEFHGSGAILIIGDSTKIGNAFVLITSNRSVKIGSNCLFSGNIDIRCTDSHKIFSKDNVQINPDKDIIIEDHCWIGKDVSILKGAHIKSGSVVGMKSVVSKTIPANCIAAGCPIRVLKESIYWIE